MVLGPRIKIINLNILSESKRLELGFSLMIAFMFLVIIVASFKLKYFSCNSKVIVLAGPWSANVVLGPRIMQTA